MLSSSAIALAPGCLLLACLLAVGAACSLDPIQFVGKVPVCYIREVSEVDPVTKTMTLRSKNLTYQNLLCVEETCVYTQDPSDLHK